jgi:hypothetical protein
MASDERELGRQGFSSTNINPGDHAGQREHAIGLAEREAQRQALWSGFSNSGQAANVGNPGLYLVIVLLALSALPFLFLAASAALVVAMVSAFAAIFGSIILFVVARFLLNQNLTLGSAAKLSFFAIAAFAVIAPVSWFCALLIADTFAVTQWEAYRFEMRREAFDFLVHKESFAQLYGRTRLAAEAEQVAAVPIDLIASLLAKSSVYLPALTACAFILRSAVGDSVRLAPRFVIAFALSAFVVFVGIGIADLVALATIRWLGY